MRCTRFQNVCPIAWSVLKRLPEDIFPTKKLNQILSMIPWADTRETPFFNRDHCLPSALRCKSTFGKFYVKMFKIKVLSRVHLNMWLFNSLHTVNGILLEGICLWTTFPPPSAVWHYIRYDDSWFLVLEPAWMTICQRWTRFFWLSLRNPTNEWYQPICILSDCLHNASFDKCVGNTYFFQMRSKAFSSCKRTSLFGYRQHFKIIRWSCSIVPKNKHFSFQLEEVNSKTDFQVEKKKFARQRFFFIETTFLCFLPLFQSQM